MFGAREKLVFFWRENMNERWVGSFLEINFNFNIPLVNRFLGEFFLIYMLHIYQWGNMIQFCRKKNSFYSLRCYILTCSVNWTLRFSFICMSNRQWLENFTRISHSIYGNIQRTMQIGAYFEFQYVNRSPQ